jgi:hypothetical protein
MTTHNNRNRQLSFPLAGFEPTISAGEWPQAHALNCLATMKGLLLVLQAENLLLRHQILPKFADALCSDK